MSEPIKRYQAGHIISLYETYVNHHHHYQGQRKLLHFNLNDFGKSVQTTLEFYWNSATTVRQKSMEISNLLFLLLRLIMYSLSVYKTKNIEHKKGMHTYKTEVGEIMDQKRKWKCNLNNLFSIEIFNRSSLSQMNLSLRLWKKFCYCCWLSNLILYIWYLIRKCENWVKSCRIFEPLPLIDFIADDHNNFPGFQAFMCFPELPSSLTLISL